MKISMNHSRPAGDTSCEAPEIAAELKAYIDNELSFLQRRTVSGHLRQCAVCRAEITAMTKIASEIKTADAAATVLHPDMRQRLLERMTTEKPASPSVPTARAIPLWRRKPLLVFGGGAAYAALFLITATILFPTFFKAREKARMVSSGPPSFQARNDVGIKSEGQYYSEPFPKQLFTGANLPANAREYSAVGAKTAVSGLITERQVHREGSITVAVDKLETASDKIEQVVKASGGFVASSNLATDDGGFKSADLSVRVPVDQFDDMLRQFAALGNVTAKSISGEDITERVSDVTQGEQVLRDAADRAARRLKITGGTEKEVRYREASLRQIKIELAQTQARLSLLRKMARLSTINVSLTEKAKRAAQTPPQGGFLGDLSETNRMASAAFASAIRVPVVLIIWVLAFSPLWVPLLLIYRYASRRSAREMDTTSPVSSIEAS